MLGGVDWLQGEWQQEVNPADTALVSYSINKYRFACDSVYISMQVFSKVDTATSKCADKGKWMEYAVANYKMDKDTLRIKGFYAKPDFTIKNIGCHHIGVYEENLLIRKKAEGHLSVTNLLTAMDDEMNQVSKKVCGE